jgi:hypothetical protein
LICGQLGQGLDNKRPKLLQLLSTTFKDTLGPDLAERVDCPLIDQVLGVNAATPVEGFVVFEVPKLPPPQGKKQPIPLFLDVVGKHTSRPLLPGASSIQIFRYVPTTNISD